MRKNNEAKHDASWYILPRHLVCEVLPQLFLLLMRGGPKSKRTMVPLAFTTMPSTAGAERFSGPNSEDEPSGNEGFIFEGGGEGGCDGRGDVGGSGGVGSS